MGWAINGPQGLYVPPTRKDGRREDRTII
jgi:hypothetical protein